MSTYYFLPTRNVFGMGAVNEAGDLMKSLGGSKTLIVTDKFLAQCGMAGRAVSYTHLDVYKRQVAEISELSGTAYPQYPYAL